MSAFSLLIPPINLTIYLQRPIKRSATPCQKIDIAESSVCCLTPNIYGAQWHELMSCYAFFKGWLLLSLPLSCLDHRTSLLVLSNNLGTLYISLGSFPLGCRPFRQQPVCFDKLTGIRSLSRFSKGFKLP